MNTILMHCLCTALLRSMSSGAVTRSMTHAMIPREDRIKGGLPDGLVRISVGLESMHDLVADVKQSLDRCDEEDRRIVAGST